MINRYQAKNLLDKGYIYIVVRVDDKTDVIQADQIVGKYKTWESANKKLMKNKNYDVIRTFHYLFPNAYCEA